MSQENDFKTPANVRTLPPADTCLMDLDLDDGRPFINDLTFEELKGYSPKINKVKYMESREDEPNFEQIDGLVLFNKNKKPYPAHSRYIANVWCRVKPKYPWKNVTFIVDTGAPDSFILPETKEQLVPPELDIIGTNFRCYVQNSSETILLNVVPTGDTRLTVNLLGVNFFNQFKKSVTIRERGQKPDDDDEKLTIELYK